MLASNDNGLYLLDLGRRTRKRINCCGRDLAVSPDQSKIAYQRGRSLYVSGIDGHGVRRLIQTPKFVDPY